MVQGFKNCQIIDVVHQCQIRSETSLLVENGRIIELGNKSAFPKGVKVYDLRGKYVMPGMINLHCHLPGDGKPQIIDDKTADLIQSQLNSKIGKWIMTEMSAKNAREELLSGVTTIRTVGGLSNIDTVIREQINCQVRQGPRIFAGNTAISVPGGHMAGTLAYIARDAEDVRRYVNQIISEQVDLVKLMVTGGTLDIEEIGDEGKILMHPDWIKAASEMAKEYNLPVAAHVQSGEGAKVCLLNGVTTIEHGGNFDDETISLFLSKKAALISTFTTVASMACLPLEKSCLTKLYRDSCEKFLEDTIEGFNKAIHAGVTIGMGLDNGSPFMTHNSMWRELYFMNRYLDLSEADVIYIATMGNAQILQKSQLIGSIEEGKIADFIAVEENPVKNLDTLSHPKLVVKDGILYKRTRNSRRNKYDRVLDEVKKCDHKYVKGGYR